MTTTFEQVFGRAPEAVADAPGRVNLLGEHTDYNDGFVLPTAIPQRMTVAVARGPGPGFRLHAVEFGETVDFDLARPPTQHHAQYVYGCLRELADDGAVLPPIDLHVHSTVPIGVGLSSSAALEVATLRALRALLSLPIDDVRVAQLAQRAEIRHAGVQCGIMDQMASSLAGEGSMLFLDTRSLERQVKPLPAGASILVLDSGVPRSLADSGYNARRDECREAARRLGVASLRDVTDPAAVEALPPPLRGRARHVVTENARVLQAAAGVDARRFGELMDASHASLRDDYEVSIPALDLLVSLLQAHPEVFGARLTGAGFGGACVALVVPGREAAIAAQVLAAYAAAGHRGAQRVPEPEVPADGGTADPAVRDDVANATYGGAMPQTAVPAAGTSGAGHAAGATGAPRTAGAAGAAGSAGGAPDDRSADPNRAPASIAPGPGADPGALPPDGASADPAVRDEAGNATYGGAMPAQDDGGPDRPRGDAPRPDAPRRG